MERIKNPELSRQILNHLATKYKIKEVRQGIHLSTLVYCLTRSFFSHTAEIDPTDKEVMLFALGLGLQDVLTPPDALTPIYEKDGITYSPDFQLKVAENTCELKTTRASSHKYEEGQGGLPETWVEYIKGGCYILGVNTYNLIVLYMLGNYKPPFPTIDSELLIFSDGELQENWQYLLDRKVIYEAALAANKPPKPKAFCKIEWECKYCRFKLVCNALLYQLPVGAGP